MAKKPAAKKVGVRTTREVAKRILGLLACNARAYYTKTDVKKMLTGEDIDASLSPEERKFFNARRHTYHQRAQASWGIEAANVLVWALGFGSATLSQPNDKFHPKIVRKLLEKQKLSGLIENAKPVSKAVLTRTLERVYQTHWAVRDAQLNSTRPPKRVDPGIVLEQHRALEWLMSRDQDWDDVTTDT